MSEPFTAFNFRVEILPAGASEPLCDAAFAECDGLELRLDTIRIREGGDGLRQRLLAGSASYGEVTLRRGMTESFDLWRWFASVLEDRSVRADARVIMLAGDGATEHARFRLSRCLPVRLRAPRLDALGGGVVAIEELQLACESIALEDAGGEGAAGPDVRAELQDPEEPGRRLAVQLNPATLRLVHGSDGESALSFTLWFEAGAHGDVREFTRPIAALARRPAVRLAWGTFRFDGRIVALEEEIDLFARDGRALRAALAVTMTGS